MAADQAEQCHGQVQLQQLEQSCSEGLHNPAKSCWAFPNFRAVVASCLNAIKTCTVLTRLRQGVCAKMKNLLGIFQRRKQEEVFVSSDNDENDGDKPEPLAPACQQTKRVGDARDTCSVRPEFLDLTTQRCGESAKIQAEGVERGSGTLSWDAQLLAFVNIPQHLSNRRSAARLPSDEGQVTRGPYSAACFPSPKGYIFALVILLSTLRGGRPLAFPEWLKLFDLEWLRALCLRVSPFRSSLLHPDAAATPYAPANWSSFVVTLLNCTGVCGLAAPAKSALSSLCTFVKVTLRTCNRRSNHVFALPPSPLPQPTVEKIRYEASRGFRQSGQESSRVLRFPPAGDSEEILHPSGEKETCASPGYVGVLSHDGGPMTSGSEQKKDEKSGSASAGVSNCEINQHKLAPVVALACGMSEQVPNIFLEKNKTTEFSEQTLACVQKACWRCPVSSQGCLDLTSLKTDNATTLKDLSTEDEDSVESNRSAERIFCPNGLLVERPKQPFSRNAPVKPETNCLESTTEIQLFLKARERSAKEVCTCLECRGETRRRERICEVPYPRPGAVSPLSFIRSPFGANPAVNNSKIRKHRCGFVTKGQVVDYLMLLLELPHMSPDEFEAYAALHPAPQGAKPTVKISDAVAAIRRILFGGFLCKAQSRTDVKDVLCRCLATLRRN